MWYFFYMPPDSVNYAFKAVRERLGYTQQSFAHLLGLAIRTVTHYESDRRPPTPILQKMVNFAAEHGGLEEEAKVLARAVFEDLGMEFPEGATPSFLSANLSVSNKDREHVYSLLYLLARHEELPAEYAAWAKLRARIEAKRSTTP
jgi:transcriptional regulator with XRE-family HTH domain